MTISKNLLDKAIKKATKRPKHATHGVIALGFNHKGDYVGMRSNNFGCLNATGLGRGKGKHAERELIKRYGAKIRKIVIIRSGRSGSLIAMHPCENSQKVIDKLGIKADSNNMG